MTELEKNTINTSVIPAQYYVTDSTQNDEINILVFIASILKQWKIILVILLIGTTVSYLYSSSLINQYENYTIIRSPSKSDLQVIKLNGYGIEIDNIFLQLYDNLKSPEVFKNYLIKSKFITQFYPSLKSDIDIFNSAISMSSNLDVKFLNEDNNLATKKTRIKITLRSSNEKIAIKALNQYTQFIEQKIYNDFRNRSKYTIKLSKQEIELEIAELRNIAKQTRINTIADLKETLNVANIMGVTNALFAVPTTPDSNTTTTTNSQNDAKPKTLNLYLNQVNQYQKYMMGSDYLNAEINRLQSRGNGLTADDPFIGSIPRLLTLLENLNKKSFEFEGAKLFILDKLAAQSDAAVKPNKSSIFKIGILISILIALFAVIIVISVQKYKLDEERNAST